MLWLLRMNRLILGTTGLRLPVTMLQLLLLGGEAGDGRGWDDHA